MRVVVAIAPSPMGGVERVVHQLARGLHRRQVLATVVTLLESGVEDPWLVESLRVAGIPVAAVRGHRYGYPREIAAMTRILRSHDADLLHCHGYRADVLGSVAAVLSRRPIVSTAHGFTGGGLKNRFYERLDRWCLRRMDQVMAVSSALEGQLLDGHVPRKRLHVVPNAAPTISLESRDDARAALGLSGEGVYMGWIGRMSHEKGPDLFLRAMCRLGLPDVDAVMIGDGPELRNAKALAAELGIASKVRFLGNIPEASRFLKAIDVLVVSSRTEGLPLVLLEAMGAHVPVVATAVGEIPQVLEGGKSGALIQPERPGELADAILSTLTDAPQAERRARLAQDRVARCYDVGSWLDQVVGVYRSAMDRRQS